MIEKILIHKLATYSNPVEILPKKINFIYGSNGSGKTTISNLIGNYNTSDDCVIKMKNSSSIKSLVYNKQFVEDNFSQSTKSVKGIFTLGEDSIQAQEKLKNLEDENQEKLNKIDRKEMSITEIDEAITFKKGFVMDKCWTLQQDIGNSFSNALVGYRNSKQKFFDMCISVNETWEKKDVESIDNIKAKYDISYSKESQIYPVFPTIDVTKISTIENSSLLQKVITGSADTPAGQFIEILKNSDWVKEGLEYIPNSNQQCPFCQQTMSEEIQHKVMSYFDENYEKDCQLLKEFIINYNAYFNNVEGTISETLDASIPFIDISELRTKYELLNKVLELNNEELQKKINSPSNKISIKSVKVLVEEINQIIKDHNKAIISNNDIVKNQKQEQLNCKNLLWNHIVNELKPDLEDYIKYESGKQKAKDSIGKQILKLNKDIQDNTTTIKSIEDSLTSVAPTVTEINNILKKFDFEGFHLKENKDQKGTYLILRDDGTHASSTLSEGEYNFITFLYFYYLVYGSQEKTGLSANKVIVIDDPISSLDSNVLFIVSTLVKKLINDCRNNGHGIRQVFILTHNVYFHKEITFLGSRRQFSKKEALFGIVRKKDNVSTFHTYDINPIESTYQLMWRELDSDKISAVTSFNTMRRILEYYFKIIGDMDYEKCINEFEGPDKMVCKALVSGINDGSHFISDDFVIAFDEGNIENYKRIFQLVFSNLGHSQHYNMMMG